MKHINKKLIAVLLLVFMFVLPSIASASVMYYNVKLTVNGEEQSFKVPIDLSKLSLNTTNTFKFVYTYKDGKWVLTSQGQPITETKPEKPAPSKPPVDKTPNEPPKTEPNTPQVKGLSADESKMLELLNAERKKAGLKPLENDMRLVDISRKKSKDMIDKNYFGHTSPTYGSPFDALKNNGVSYRYAGENLAGAPTVERAHSGLMNSPGHRANILNPNFTHVGIGIVDGGPYGKMYTQTFIGIK